MPAAKLTVGVDLGGTNMQIGVVSGAGADAKVIAHAKKKTKAGEGQEAVIGRLAEGIAEACAEAKIAPADLAAVGIGAPGVIDPATGTVLEAVNLRWNDVPLAQIVKDRLKVPV